MTLPSTQADLWQEIFEGQGARAQDWRSATALAEHAVDARRDIRINTQAQGRALLILEGWAARYKQSRDGAHQILGFLLPGDLCLSSLYPQMDDVIGALTPIRYAEIPARELHDLVETAPHLALALIRRQEDEAAIQREWIFNIGQRPAAARIAHLLCETYARLEARGLAGDSSCPLPLTQQDLASATGLTAVHVNRTLQELRRSGLIELHSKRLHILDRKGLQQAAGFDEGYLRLAQSSGDQRD